MVVKKVVGNFGKWFLLLNLVIEPNRTLKIRSKVKIIALKINTFA